MENSKLEKKETKLQFQIELQTARTSSNLIFSLGHINLNYRSHFSVLSNSKKKNIYLYIYILIKKWAAMDVSSVYKKL